MTIKLTTHQIQLLAIGAIEIMCDSDCELHQRWAPDYREILDTLRDLNSLCAEENDYALTLEVSA